MSNICWSCGELIPSLTFCPVCKKIQPPKTIEDAFQYFDLPYTFNIDKDLLQKKYFQLQTHVHPDRFMHASALEKTYAEQHTAHLNEAYGQLKNPIYRAEILLNHQNQSINTHAPEVLMTTMLWQEKIAEAQTTQDLEQLFAQIQEEIQRIYNQLNTAFETNHIIEAPILAGTLQYLLKVQQQLRHKIHIES